MESDMQLPEIEKTHVHIDLDNYYFSRKFRSIKGVTININGKVYNFTVEEISRFLDYILARFEK